MFDRTFVRFRRRNAFVRSAEKKKWCQGIGMQQWMKAWILAVGTVSAVEGREVATGICTVGLKT